ncbi:MAG: AbrB/MazE/SpoVT family DNA-binding domain-containing protein [Nitrososphaerales archaeon]
MNEGQLSYRLSQVKVKRKGQVTIPAELRRKLKIEEGSMLEVEESEGGILLKSVAPVKGGSVVGEKAYRDIVSELDELRRKKWR